MQRTRNQSIPTVMSDLGRYYYDGVLQETPTFGPYPVKKYQKVFTDVVEPNFRRKVAEGEIINHPCNLEIIDYVHTGHMVEQTWTTSSPTHYGRNTTGNFYEHLFSFGADSRSHNEAQEFLQRSLAKSKLLALANVDASPYAFAEDIGELAETIRLLRNPLETLYSLSKSFRNAAKGRVADGSARDIAEAIAAVWATGQFGFLPLLRSILDAIEIYNGNRPKDRNKRLIARGITSDQGYLNETHSFNGTYEWDSSLRYTHLVRAYILYEITNPLQNWSFHLGVRPTDLPVTFWALMPYSFMVDRMVDISTSLKALVALSSPEVVMLAAGTVHKEQVDITYSNLTWNDPSHVTSYLSSSGLKNNRFIYNRTIWVPSVLDALPVPEWGGLVDSATKLIDLIALTLLALRGR